MLNRVPPQFAISAAGASVSSGTVVFSNSNGVTFGQNGSTVTASVAAAGGNFSAGVSTAGNTAGSTGVTGSRLVFVGTQNITLSQSTDANGGTISISGGAGAAGNTGFISAGGATASLGTVVFSNSNGVSFGVNGQTVTGSIATSLTNIRVSGGTTSNLLSAITFSNSNGVSFGLNGSTMTASVATSLTNVNVSAGTTSNNLSAITFSNSNGVSFGLNGSTITGSVAAQTTQSAIEGLGVSNTGNTAGNTGISTGIDWVIAGSGGITASQSTAAGTNTIWLSVPTGASATGNFGAVAAGTQTATSGTVVFSDSNGISFGMSGSTRVTASYTVPTVTNSSWTVSDSATSLTVARLAFTASNGLTLTLSTNGASATVIGSYTVPTVPAQLSVGVSTGGNTSGDTGLFTGRVVLAGGNNVTLSGSSNAGSATITISAASQSAESQSIGMSNLGNTSGTTGIASGAQVRFLFAGGNNITLSQSLNGASGTITISAGNAAPSPVNFSAGTTSNNLGSVVFSNSNGVSFGLDGSTITASVNAGGGFSAGVSTAGNTAGATGVSGSQMVLVGTGVVTLSQTTGANGNTVSVAVPATSSLSAENLVTIQTNVSTIRIGAQLPVISSYENLSPFVSNITQALTPGSVSFAVAFQLPNSLSASFLRLPIALTTNSTTLSTANASASMSAEVYSTWNAVVYSLGTGASSKSLISVASGSVGWTVQNSQSVTGAGTQGSYTQAMSYGVEGVNTNTSTQYSISNTNYSWVTTFWHSFFTGSRFLDINFPRSLSAGAYWLIFGLSTSSSSNSARISAATNCRVGYASHYGASQANLNFGIMGSTNLTSGGLLGAGSFSTAGGGTTSILPISAISSSASNVRPYFQMLRSA